MSVHKFDGNSPAYNFFFHPLHQNVKTVFAVITNIFLTAITGGLWQIPFWIVNRLDHKRVCSLNKDATAAINKVSTTTFKPKATSPESTTETPVKEIFKTEKSKLPDFLNKKIDTGKIYQPQIKIPAPVFTPLELKDVENLINEFPDLAKFSVAQGNLSALESIKAIHEKGIPRRLSELNNEELKTQMQYIIFRISQEKNPKREEMLTTLVSGLVDCVPVTVRSVDKMYRKLVYPPGFTLAMDTFVATFKEEVLDDTIEKLFPEMKEASYAQKNHENPPQQFPHVKNGFIRLCGPQLGLNDMGVEDDFNANEWLADERKEDFLNTFNNAFSLEQVVKKFILKLNNDNPKHLPIDKEEFFQWAGENDSLKHKIFFDEEATYPEYCEKPNSDQESLTSPFITEELAVNIFQELGYIKDKTDT